MSGPLTPGLQCREMFSARQCHVWHSRRFRECTKPKKQSFFVSFLFLFFFLQERFVFVIHFFWSISKLKIFHLKPTYPSLLFFELNDMVYFLYLFEPNLEEVYSYGIPQTLAFPQPLILYTFFVYLLLNIIIGISVIYCS